LTDRDEIWYAMPYFTSNPTSAEKNILA